MDRETFLESLKAQLSNEIQEALIESKNVHGVNWKKLDRILVRLRKQAQIRGLSRSEFDDLLRNAIPDWSTSIKKAA